MSPHKLEAQIITSSLHSVEFSSGIFRINADYFTSKLKDFTFPISFFVDAGLISAQPDIQKSILSLQKQIKCTKVLFHCFDGGEACKNNPNSLKEAYRTLLSDGLCKKSLLILVGGGAFLDLFGFAASTFHRGIPYWRLPSTTLSQCDSGVGVKTSVNFNDEKNTIGSYSIPERTICDFELLKSLPERDWNSALGEFIKIAMLKSESYFCELEKMTKLYLSQDKTASRPLIETCAKYHFKHITEKGDPFEKNRSRPLDFGHWAAHQLEKILNFEIRHGEAVLLGIALDCLYALRIGVFDSVSFKRVIALIRFAQVQPLYSSFLNTSSAKELIEGLETFRQHIGGDLCICLPLKIGHTTEVNHIDLGVMNQCIHELDGILKAN